VWHGAAWTYFVFGCVQGIALSVTHWFQEVHRKPRFGRKVALLAVASLVLWQSVSWLSPWIGRPGVSLFVGALLTGAWVVGALLFGASHLRELASLGRVLAIARRVLSMIVAILFGLIIMVVVHGLVHDTFGVALDYRLLGGVAILVAAPLGFRYLQLRFSTVFAIAANFTFVGITFTMFRAASLDKAWAMYERLLTLTTYTPNLHRNVLLIILGALVLQWTPRRVYDRAREAFIGAPAPMQALVLFSVAVALRQAATAAAVPFVYFQF
jgi:hypothetical protein